MIIVDTPRQHAGLRQLHEAVHDHLAGAVQTAFERRQITDARRQVVVAGTHGRQGGAIVRVVALAQLQRVHQCIRQRADTDLQGSTIAHQGARVQAQGELDHVHRFARQGEQCLPAGAIVQHDIEEIRVDFRLVADERQVRMHHADHQRPRRAGRGDAIQQIGSHIRIARETVALASAFSAHRDQLREQVDSGTDQIACDMGVVHADVVALGLRDTEHGAGLQIELMHADVLGQRIGVLCCNVIQVRIIRAEVPGKKRLKKPPLQFALRVRPRQRQCCIQSHAQAGIRGDAPVKRIEQHVRLAQAQRHRHAQIAVRMLEHALDAGFDILNKRSLPAHSRFPVVRRTSSQIAHR